FTRRFQSVVYFPVPSVKERYELWQKYFGHLNYEKEIDFRPIAEKYELTGGNIVNVLKYCAVKSVKNKDFVSLENITDGIKRELTKDGKTL
ncbi:MAG: AAA family ATPase, partial [Marinilabiliales bacterium]